jgi:sugar phosphate isomerase/epimerase
LSPPARGGSVPPAVNLQPFEPLPALAGDRAFRLGVTSYVYPADILPNVRSLAPRVDDIELVFFESADASNLPAPADVAALCELADAHGLTYTVHFPIDRKLGSESRAERSGALDMILRLVDLTRPLAPHGYIVHVEGLDRRADAARVAAWQADARPLLGRICAAAGDPRRVCIENLDYPFAWCDPFLAAHDAAVCLDIGHLWQSGQDWRAETARLLPRTRVVHLYGTGEGTGHYSLDRTAPGLLREVVAALGGFSGVLTLETFGYDETRSSIERLKACLRGNDRSGA